jgi:DNA-binding NarL/FixJ family response regulator
MSLFTRRSARNGGPVVLFAQPLDAGQGLCLDVLVAEGFTAVAADTVSDAFAYAGGHGAPRVAVFELSPSPDAWPAIAQFRREHPDAAVVVTTYGLRPNRRRRRMTRDAGCAAFVAKPCSIRQFIDVIVRVAAGERGIELVDIVAVA